MSIIGVREDGEGLGLHLQGKGQEQRRRKQFESGEGAHGEREPIRGSGAEPPAGSRGRAPGHLESTIRYDTRCYFNVRSKADISQLNLPHGTDN